MTDKLTTILNSVLETESKLIPVFVHNPQSQAIAGVAMLGVHAQKAVAAK